MRAKHRSATLDLFEERVSSSESAPAREELCAGAFLLHGFALSEAEAIRRDLEPILAQAPFRHLITPGGFRMSVAMTNCGRYGWVSDRRGYRYERTDPQSGKPWPALPDSFARLACAAAANAGFQRFEPEACLINCYEPGARLSLHQDKDETDLDQPIVSVSLGLPATFLLGGLERSARPRRVPVRHGDVAVWGGPARLLYHGVMPLEGGTHPFMGERRINLTFRKAR